MKKVDFYALLSAACAFAAWNSGEYIWFLGCCFWMGFFIGMRK